jgi:hypothetical protein
MQVAAVLAAAVCLALAGCGTAQKHAMWRGSHPVVAAQSYNWRGT